MVKLPTDSVLVSKSYPPLNQRGLLTGFVAFAGCEEGWEMMGSAKAYTQWRRDQ
jgi:hypothetical protein